MLWPEARRSPSVCTAGATPTPSADTRATARPAATSSRGCRKRSRLSSGKRDSAYVVVTTGRASAGTRANASSSTSTASPRSSWSANLRSSCALLALDRGIDDHQHTTAENQDVEISTYTLHDRVNLM